MAKYYASSPEIGLVPLKGDGLLEAIEDATGRSWKVSERKTIPILNIDASVPSHKFAVFQSGPEASTQGAGGRQYREYCQGRQRRGGASGPLPKGASPAARGRVALLGNGAGHYLRTAPRHTPRGTR